MDLRDSLTVAAAGMKVQGTRIKVIAENMANSDSTAETPNDLPYRRKVITFENAMDRQLGVEMVRVHKIDKDRSDFQRRYDPTHPSANAEGYVLYPNVNSLVEANDMREAQRSYEANLSVIEASKTLLTRTIEILRG
jgi:flagellar basal-body rod protein FlgC